MRWLEALSSVCAGVINNVFQINSHICGTLYFHEYFCVWWKKTIQGVVTYPRFWLKNDHVSLYMMMFCWNSTLLSNKQYSTQNHCIQSLHPVTASCLACLQCFCFQDWTKSVWDITRYALSLLHVLKEILKQKNVGENLPLCWRNWHQIAQNQKLFALSWGRNSISRMHWKTGVVFSRHAKITVWMLKIQAITFTISVLKQDPEQQHAKWWCEGVDKSNAIATLLLDRSSNTMWRLYMASNIGKRLNF